MSFSCGSSFTPTAEPSIVAISRHCAKSITMTPRMPTARSERAVSTTSSVSCRAAHIRSMQHNITTVNFAINGDSAEGEIYTISMHTFTAGDRDVDVTVGGRYLDKYEKRHDTWKIIARTIVTDWANVNDPSSST